MSEKLNELKNQPQERLLQMAIPAGHKRIAIALDFPTVSRAMDIVKQPDGKIVVSVEHEDGPLAFEVAKDSITNSFDVLKLGIGAPEPVGYFDCVNVFSLVATNAVYSINEYLAPEQQPQDAGPPLA